jgi:hypothetical protein
MGNSWQSPTTGEPSLGTPHITNDANRSASLVVNTTTNTAGAWSTGYIMTGVPTGAKSATCIAEIFLATQFPFLCCEAASGYSLLDITSGANRFRYHGVQSWISAGSGPTVIKIHLDSSKQFKWCSSITNCTVRIGSAIDYEM